MTILHYLSDRFETFYHSTKNAKCNLIEQSSPKYRLNANKLNTMHIPSNLAIQIFRPHWKVKENKIFTYNL